MAEIDMQQSSLRQLTDMEVARALVAKSQAIIAEAKELVRQRKRIINNRRSSLHDLADTGRLNFRNRLPSKAPSQILIDAQ